MNSNRLSCHMSENMLCNFQRSLNSHFAMKKYYASSDFNIINADIVRLINDFVNELLLLVIYYEEGRELGEVEPFQIFDSEYFSFRHFYYFSMGDIAKYMISSNNVDIASYVNLESRFQGLVFKLAKNINKALDNKWKAEEK